jgi:hypothetical protein
MQPCFSQEDELLRNKNWNAIKKNTNWDVIEHLKINLVAINKNKNWK